VNREEKHAAIQVHSHLYIAVLAGFVRRRSAGEAVPVDAAKAVTVGPRSQR
jgi:hypothetical protein